MESSNHHPLLSRNAGIHTNINSAGRNGTLTPTRTVLLDGALATELERHAPDTPLNTPLWSAQKLLSRPALAQHSPSTNLALIQKVHVDYYRAGAEVAITASYQASTRGLMLYAPDVAPTEQDAIAIVKRSVEVARAARDEVNAAPSMLPQRGRPLLVAGSVGPYGAFLADGSEYTGSYGLASPDVSSGGDRRKDSGPSWSPAAFHEDMKSFHRGRIRALLDACADLLAVETQPSFNEIKAVCELLSEEFPTAKAWVSCTIRSGDEGVTLSDGTSLKMVAQLLDQSQQVLAIGVNCCPVELVTPALKVIKQGTNKPLVAYPNSGETWDAQNKVWCAHEDKERNWSKYVDEWRALGAGLILIGGCCRTDPADIRAMLASC